MSSSCFACCAGSALGVCQDLGGRRFALTSAGALLRADAEGSLRGEVLFYRDMSTGGFADIPEIVRTGRVGHSVTLGPEGFDQLAYHPDRLDAMHQTMVGSSRDIAVDLCRIYDFSAHRTLVDAGGGYGGLLAAVLQSCKHLTGSVFDLPSVERGALAYLEGQRRPACAGFVPGSFFDGPRRRPTATCSSTSSTTGTTPAPARSSPAAATAWVPTACSC